MRIFGVIATLIGSAAVAASALSWPPSAQACVHGSAYDHVYLPSNATGGRATSPLADMNASDLADPVDPGSVNETIWLGTSMSFVITPTTSATWAEVGVVEGFRGNRDATPIYYQAHGINYPYGPNPLYGDMNLNTEPPVRPPHPTYGATHTLGVVINSTNSGWVLPTIDNVGYWQYYGHFLPAVDVGVGYEATCIDAGGTRVSKIRAATHAILERNELVECDQRRMGTGTRQRGVSRHSVEVPMVLFSDVVCRIIATGDCLLRATEDVFEPGTVKWKGFGDVRRETSSRDKRVPSRSSCVARELRQ
jgi:hypothetical protein